MNETKKWILHRISAIILAPLFVWLYFSLVSLSTKSYADAIIFFQNPLFKILTIIIFFIGFFHAKISLSEIYEDYIKDKKIKDNGQCLECGENGSTRDLLYQYNAEDMISVRNYIEDHLTMHPKHKSMKAVWCDTCKTLNKYLVQLI